MEMGRTRTTSRAGWPDNLYPNRAGFKYRHPLTRKETWMGQDKAKAFAAAKKLNALLAQTDNLVGRVVGAAKTVADALKVFREDVMPQRRWKDSTAREYGIVLRRAEKDIGERVVETFTVKDAATWIRAAKGSRGRQTRKLVLGWVLACAVAEGWAEFNVAEQTLDFTFTRKRERLTLDTFKAIRDKAAPWLQNAMDLSLLTLLRREDVAYLRFADAHDGALWVVPAKTEDNTSVKLCIALTPALAALVARCRDDVASPFLIHRLLEKARPQHLRAKDRVHHTQVMPADLSRAFADARTLAGIEGDHPPTFHEIRSLGGSLLREQGWTLEQVQALMGHASQTMTKVYLAGHETPWQQVTPGLSLQAIGWE